MAREAQISGACWGAAPQRPGAPAIPRYGPSAPCRRQRHPAPPAASQCPVGLTLIGNSRGAQGAAEQRVARGAGPGGPARKGPTGGWVERRAGGGGNPLQDPLIRASRAIGDFRSRLIDVHHCRRPGTARSRLSMRDGSQRIDLAMPVERVVANSPLADLRRPVNPRLGRRHRSRGRGGMTSLHCPDTFTLDDHLPASPRPR
jgi:hypothetical protein